MRLALRDLCVHGSLDSVVIGSTQSAVLQSLGPPDAVGGTSNRSPEPRIWKYGDLEVHFSQRSVSLLHLDTFSGAHHEPVGTPSLFLDPWIIAGGLVLLHFRRALASEQLAFSVTARRALGQRIVEFRSGTQVGFLNHRGSFRLVYLSRSKPGSA